MDIKELISKVESSQEFIDFMASEKESYLANVFQIIEQGKSIWQVGYFNSTSDRMTLFVFLDSLVKVIPNQEIFKKPGSEVLKLDLDKVKVSFDDASKQVDKIVTEKYCSLNPRKKIIILQNQNNQIIWNFTLMAQSTPINIRIDAVNYEIVSDKKIDLINKKESFK